jgi:hypothetical protein
MPYAYQEFPNPLWNVIIEKPPQLRVNIERFNNDARVLSSIPASKVVSLKVREPEYGFRIPHEFFYHMTSLETIDFEHQPNFVFANYDPGPNPPPIKRLKIG